jgi:hypothetical protein
MKQIADINKHLLEERANYKGVYDLLYNQSQVEGRILDVQEDELNIIKTTDALLSKKLKELEKKMGKKAVDLKKKQKMTDVTASNLRALNKKYSKLKETLEKEKALMEKLIKENKDQEMQIDSLTNDVVNKMKTSSDNIDGTIDEVKDIPKKFKSFMSKKDKILKILNGISYNEGVLKERLLDLIKKESAINITDESGNVVEEIQELEKGLTDIAKKKGLFETEIKKIFDLLKL